MFRLIMRSFFISVTVSLLCTAIFFSFGYWAAGLDKSVIALKVRTAALSGEFSATIRPFLLKPDYQADIWKNNECMILFMLTASNYQTRLQEAISPLQPPQVMYSSCPPLIQHVTAEKVAGSFYHRYLHGYRVATALLLQVLPIGAIPTALTLFVHALAGAIVAIAGTRAWRTSQGSDDAVAVWLSYAFLGIALLIFWGLPHYGISISFAFGDAVVLLLVLTFLLLNPMEMSDNLFAIVCSTGGALVAWFEFLTGQIPIAAAAIPFCVVASSFGKSDHVRLVVRSLLGPGLFIFTGALCFLLKYALAVVVFGTSVLTDAGREFLVVTGGLGPEFTPKAQALIEQLGLPSKSDGSPAHRVFWLFASLAFGSPTIGLGSFFFGTAIAVGSTVALAVAVVVVARSAKGPADYARIGATAVSFAMLCGWYAVFHAHATYHGSFMIRPLALLPALAVIAWLQVFFVKRQRKAAAVVPTIS